MVGSQRWKLEVGAFERYFHHHIPTIIVFFFFFLSSIHANISDLARTLGCCERARHHLANTEEG